MPRETPVHEVMTTDVVYVAPDDRVTDAMERLVAAEVDAAPVLRNGVLIGMLSTSDLIVRGSRLHMPTMVNLLGATLELPGEKKKFDEDIGKKLGGTVLEVMSDETVSISPDASVEAAATSMHDNDVSRLPVLDGEGALVGIIARHDILKALVRRNQGA